MPTAELGPKRIKALRRRMIDEGQSRKYINGMIGVLKSMLRWGMEEELIDASKLNLAVLAKGVCWLRKGRSDAYEPAPIRPVPDALVEKIRDHVAPEIWGMIQFQLATGARPGEVTILRMKDINTTGPVWEYRPSDHKTAHHGRERVVMIGPAGQAVLREFMPTSTEAFVFSPDADGRRPYRRDSYTLAIRRGCELAFKMPKELRDIGRTVKRMKDATNAEKAAARERLSSEAAEWREANVWTPNQLRHNFGTKARRTAGLEAARVTLGHSSASVSEIYAERDLDAARAVVAKIG